MLHVLRVLADPDQVLTSVLECEFSPPTGVAWVTTWVVNLVTVGMASFCIGIYTCNRNLLLQHSLPGRWGRRLWQGEVAATVSQKRRCRSGIARPVQEASEGAEGIMLHPPAVQVGWRWESRNPWGSQVGCWSTGYNKWGYVAHFHEQQEPRSGAGWGNTSACKDGLSEGIPDLPSSFASCSIDSKWRQEVSRNLYQLQPRTLTSVLGFIRLGSLNWLLPVVINFSKWG